MVKLDPPKYRIEADVISPDGHSEVQEIWWNVDHAEYRYRVDTEVGSRTFWESELSPA